MQGPNERLSLGRYLGSIDYPDGHRLDELDVIVDDDGNLEVMWLALPGKPAAINRQPSTVGSAYMVAFEDGTMMHLREQHS